MWIFDDEPAVSDVVEEQLFQRQKTNGKRQKAKVPLDAARAAVAY
jgi:hypothetical protein